MVLVCSIMLPEVDDFGSKFDLPTNVYPWTGLQYRLTLKPN